MNIAVGVLIALHGLVHAILAMVPSPVEPGAGFATFYSGLGSWLLSRLGLSEAATRATSILLSALAALGFVAAGLSILGILVPSAWWRPLAVASASVSLLFLLSFWHRYLIVGVLIDGAVLATLLFTRWSPS